MYSLQMLSRPRSPTNDLLSYNVGALVVSFQLTSRNVFLAEDYRPTI